MRSGVNQLFIALTLILCILVIGLLSIGYHSALRHETPSSPGYIPGIITGFAVFIALVVLFTLLPENSKKRLLEISPNASYINPTPAKSRPVPKAPMNQDHSYKGDSIETRSSNNSTATRQMEGPQRQIRPSHTVLPKHNTVEYQSRAEQQEPKVVENPPPDQVQNFDKCVEQFEKANGQLEKCVSELQSFPLNHILSQCRFCSHLDRVKITVENGKKKAVSDSEGEFACAYGADTGDEKTPNLIFLMTQSIWHTWLKKNDIGMPVEGTCRNFKKRAQEDTN